MEAQGVLHDSLSANLTPLTTFARGGGEFKTSTWFNITGLIGQDEPQHAGADR
jgi:hypothetical protein